MSDAKLYSIFLARTRYLESEVQKLRPVIAGSKPYGKHKVLMVIPVSSQPTITEIDVDLNDWQAGNLLKPSVARVHRLGAILQADLLEEIGQVSPGDVVKIQQALKLLLELK